MNVTLVDSMGTDLSVVNAARVSFAKVSEWDIIPHAGPTPGLLKYEDEKNTVGQNVRPECFVLFEEWVREISRAAANCIEGHRGTLIIRAPTSTKKTACTHVLIYAYDTREHMNQWHDNPIRKDLVDRMLPLLVRDNTTSVRVYDSCKSFALFLSLILPHSLPTHTACLTHYHANCLHILLLFSCYC